jgi:hypothetical protein
MPPTKKQHAAIQPLTASCSTPLIPCPLVQPPAQRAPNPRITPPASATVRRSAPLRTPNAAAHRDGTQIEGKVAGEQRRKRRAHDYAENQHPPPS